MQKKDITSYIEVNFFLHFFTFVTAIGSAYGFQQIFEFVLGRAVIAWIIGIALGFGVARLMVVRTYYISNLADYGKLGLFKAWMQDFADPVVGPVRAFGIYGVCAMLYAGIFAITIEQATNEQIATMLQEHYRNTLKSEQQADSLVAQSLEWYKRKRIMTYGFAPLAAQQAEHKRQFAQRADSLLYASISALKQSNQVNQLQLIYDAADWLQISKMAVALFLCFLLAMQIDGAVVFFARLRKKMDAETNALLAIGSGKSGNDTPVSTLQPVSSAETKPESIKISSELEQQIVNELTYNLHKSQRQIARDLGCSHTLVNEINKKYGVRENG
jgi:hypothetical protein